MHITTNNTNNYNDYRPNFASRHAIIRDLGDISMLVKREFPIISNTNIEAKKNYCTPAYNLYRFSSGLINEIRSFSKINSTPAMNIIKSIDAIKQFKVGNCGEASLVSYIACKLNGYKDAKEMFLYAYNTKTNKLRRLDHTVVGVNFKNPSKIKPKDFDGEIYLNDNSGIIVDSWLGKVDYAKNMNTEYNLNHFGKALSPDEKLCYCPKTERNELSSKDMLYIENQHPTIVKNRKNCILKKIRYKLIPKNKYKYEPIRNSLKEIYKRNYHLKNSLPQSEISKMIKEEMETSKKLKNKKKNFIRRFIDEVNEVARQQEEAATEAMDNLLC